MAGKKLPFETETEVTHTRRTTVVLNEQRLERLLKDYVLNELGIRPGAGVKVGVTLNKAGEARIVVIEDFQDQAMPQDEADPEGDLR